MLARAGPACGIALRAVGYQSAAASQNGNFSASSFIWVARRFEPANFFPGESLFCR